MKIKLMYGLTVVFVVAVIVSWLGSDTRPSKATKVSSPEAAESGIYRSPQSMQGAVSGEVPETGESDKPVLPITLLGITFSPEPSQSLALIRFRQITSSYHENEQIADSDMYVDAIEKNKIIVRLNEQRFEVMITRTAGESTGTEKIKQPAEEAESAGQVTSVSQIGNRPRALSHIVTLPDNQPMKVTPGLNPTLYKNAGFEPGDELLSVNDQEVSDDDAMDKINRLIRTEHTLTFEVLRNGRRVTLYLDIPSESLKVR